MTESVIKFLDDLIKPGNRISLVVFCVAPDAEARVRMKRVEVLVGGVAVRTDDLHTEDCDGSVYMAHVKNAKAGTVLKMWFGFTPASGPATPTAA